MNIMGKRSVSGLITLLLSIVGLAIAVFLTVVHYRGSVEDICSAGAGGCSGVLGSQYAMIGPIPTAVFGALMYLALIVFGFMRLRQLSALREAEGVSAAEYATGGADGESEEPNTDVTNGFEAGARGASAALRERTSKLRSTITKLDMTIWLLAAVGFATSWWLQYTAIFVLAALCPYCLASAVVVTLIFILASLDYLVVGRTIGGEQKMLAGVTAFILVMVGLMCYPQVSDQIKVIERRGQRVFVEPDRLRRMLVRPNLYWRGPGSAPFILVEFADYMCPACKRASEHLDEVLNAAGGKLRFTFRDLPLTMIKEHKWSEQAAEASQDAGEQGKFWEMHDWLYRHQADMEKADFTPGKFIEWAGQLGLDVKRFKSDFDARKFEPQIEADRETARELQVSSTPTFIIASPKRIYRCVGIDALRKTVANPEDPIWSQ